MRAIVGAAGLLLLAGCGNPTTPAAPAVPTAPSPTVTTSPPAPSAVPTTAPPIRIKPTSPQSETVTRPPRVRYAFPIAGCSASYGRSHHDYPATDVFAARGCSVVAPVTGRVDEVSATDRWDPATNKGADRGGLSFSVVGDDGVRYYGSHLSALLVRAGQRVTAGQRIGRVGNSGDARGIATHLHFGISWPTRPGVWWVRRGEVYPWPYLDSWRTGGQKSPAAAVAARHRASGDVPPCPGYC